MTRRVFIWFPIFSITFLGAQHPPLRLALGQGRYGYVIATVDASLARRGSERLPPLQKIGLLTMKAHAQAGLDEFAAGRVTAEQAVKQCADLGSHPICADAEWTFRRIVAEDREAPVSIVSQTTPASASWSEHRQSYLAGARNALTNQPKALAQLEKAANSALTARPVDWEIYARASHTMAEQFLARGDRPRASTVVNDAVVRTSKALPSVHPDRLRLERLKAQFLSDAGETKCALIDMNRLVPAAATHGDSLFYAITLSRRAYVGANEKDFLAQASLDLKKAIAIRKSRAPHRLEPIASLQGLRGHVLQEIENHIEESRQEFEAAIAVQSKGSNKELYADTLHNYSLLLVDMGWEHLPEAMKKLREAIDLNPSQSSRTRYLTQLALMLWADNRAQEALDLLQPIEDVRDSLLTAGISHGTPWKRHQYTKSIKNLADLPISLCLQPLRDDPRAGEILLTNLWRRKGRIANTLGAELDLLRSRSDRDAQNLIDEIHKLRQEIASVTLGGLLSNVPMPELPELHVKEERLLQRLTSMVGGVAFSGARAATSEVRQKIAADSIVLEYFFYRPYAGRQRLWSSTADKLLVLGVTQSGPILFQELGTSQQDEKFISALAKQWREEIAERKPAAQATGAKLADIILKPISSWLDGKRTVIVSPDGYLGLIPFAALPLGKSLLGEKATLSYVDSGRDILSWTATRRASAEPGAPVVFYDLDYGTPTERDAWSKLRFSRAEGESFEKVFYELKPQPFRTSSGTKKTFLEVRNPLLLHASTHAFFNRKAASVQPICSATKPEPGVGIVFSGANQAPLQSIATGDDVSAMDLSATELVAIAACETQLGEVGAGEGVFGLKRYFRLAGAKSTLLSLWRVDDPATTAFMNHFYQRLAAGDSKAEAVRAAQAAVRAAPGWAAPYYWAAFLLSGSPAPLPEDVLKRLSSAKPKR